MLKDPDADAFFHCQRNRGPRLLSGLQTCPMRELPNYAKLLNTIWSYKSKGNPTVLLKQKTLYPYCPFKAAYWAGISDR
jgi:hypothetical protein